MYMNAIFAKQKRKKECLYLMHMFILFNNPPVLHLNHTKLVCMAEQLQKSNMTIKKGKIFKNLFATISLNAH